MSSRKKDTADKRREISINGEVVKPGKKSTIELPVGSMIDYQPVTMTCHVRRGKKPGPCLLVTAGIHGDEINGVETIRRLLKSRLLSGLRGDLLAVPVVNMPAFLSRSRYLPDRRDLNRLFPGSTKGSLGGRLANVFVNEILEHCTHAIDIHTGAVGRPNLPQVRVSPGDEVGLEIASAFRAPVVIETPLREGSLRATYYNRARPSILFEAGEAHRLDPDSVRYGFRGIIATMRALQMLPPEKKPPKRMPKTIFSPGTTWVRAPRGGIFSVSADLGKAVSEGSEIGLVADPFGRLETKIKAKVDGVIIGISREATVDEGDALFHIATTPNPAKAEKQIEKSDRALEKHEDEFPGEI